jgi:hypothetical protein
MKSNHRPISRLPDLITALHPVIALAYNVPDQMGKLGYLLINISDKSNKGRTK